MHRRFTALLILVGSLLVLPGEALAHGFGVRYDIPVPFWLSAFGGAAAVVLTFALLVDARPVPHRYPRFDLLQVGWFRTVFASRPFLFSVRVLSVVLFSLVILSGLIGNPRPTDNLAPTFVWVIWWVGLAFLTALIGNLWELVNPWKITLGWVEGLARRVRPEKGLGPYPPYPARWGVWPALALYFGFAWVELVFVGSGIPHNISVVVLLYSLITWAGMIIFGKEIWLRGGEAFAVFFSILARFAPTEVRVDNPKVCEGCDAACQDTDGGCVNCYECFARAAPEDRQLNLRPWAVGLSRPEPITVDRLAFVIFVLASLAYDGLTATPLGLQVYRLAGSVVYGLGISSLEALYVIKTLELIVIPLPFLVTYLGFVKLAQLLSGATVSAWQFAKAFVYTLVPIALAYQAAHYYTLLVIQGQGIVALASDPFGRGWDLFGTADYEIKVGVLSADFIWYSQVALIVIGHVIAVYLAHGIALRLLRDKKRAVRSQYPMLALMVLYTVLSLWTLSQPVVEENKIAAVTTGGGRAELSKGSKESVPYAALSPPLFRRLEAEQ
jgi:hypothetical protein